LSKEVKAGEVRAGRVDRRCVFALLLLYFATRLPLLTRLPIFLDETTHIRWSLFISEGERLGRPWNYGKGLSVFLNALLFPWAFGHYLWVSRALAVAFGAATLLASVAIGRRLFGARVGLVAGLLYVACPFALSHDRLALTDPPMATFAAFALLAAVGLAESPRPLRTLLLALCLVLAVLTKATAILLLAVPVLVTGCLAPRSLRAWGAATLALAAAGGALFLPLWHFFHTTSTVRLGMGHREADLFARLRVNLPTAGEWLWTYLTAPLALLVLVGFLAALRDRSRAGLLMAGLVALPVLAFAAVSTLWFPRYVVPAIVPCVLLAAWGFARLTAHLPTGVTAALLVLLLLPAAWLDFVWLTDPPRAAMPTTDRVQFVFGWPSGYGTQGTIAAVHEELERHPEGIQVVVHSESWRTTWLALGLEFAREPRVNLRDANVGTPGGLDLLAAWAQTKPTLLVVSPVGPARSAPDPRTWQFLGTLILRSCKPDGGLCDEVYRLRPRT
jgi:4-amino-4-deoxy-L-arabinose transferase-like glycosyltransferase